MKQTLFYLPTQILGVPLFGKGILFWVILLVGLFSIVKSFIQKRRFEDTIFYAFITALGLFIVNVIGPRIAETQGFPIRGYGVFLMLAILISGGLTIWRGKRKWNYPSDLVVAAAFVAAFGGIIGARLFYVVQYWSDIKGATINESLINAIDITNGGLVVYGSILGGLVAGIAFLLFKRLPVLATLDLFAPGLALGIAIGRIGCLMNGCCFGGPCEQPWGIVFPQGSPAYMQQINEGVISLYGITLAPPEEQKKQEKTIFSLKSKHVNLASEIPAPVFVAKVDPNSEAEQAGIVPGSQICELGLVPRSIVAEKGKSSALNKKEIRRFSIQNNAQVFYFFLNLWNSNSDQDVFMTFIVPEKNNRSEDSELAEKSELQDNELFLSDVAQPQNQTDNSSQTKFRNIVFHPFPAKTKPVHPTQIYSTIDMLLIFLLLLLISRFFKRDGITFSSLLLLYPLHRFLIETIRTDEESFCGTGLTVSQCVSIFLALIGILILCYSIRAQKHALAGYFLNTQSSESK